MFRYVYSCYAYLIGSAGRLAWVKVVVIKFWRKMLNVKMLNVRLSGVWVVTQGCTEGACKMLAWDVAPENLNTRRTFYSFWKGRETFTEKTKKSRCASFCLCRISCRPLPGIPWSPFSPVRPKLSCALQLSLPSQRGSARSIPKCRKSLYFSLIFDCCRNTLIICMVICRCFAGASCSLSTACRTVKTYIYRILFKCYS